MEEEGKGNNERKITELGSQEIVERTYETEGMLRMCETLAGQHISEANAISWEGSECEGSRMDLNADLLLEVFSLLPCKDLCEVMMVSKHWERTIMAADNLWKKLEVGLGGDGSKGEGMGWEGDGWSWTSAFGQGTPSSGGVEFLVCL